MPESFGRLVRLLTFRCTGKKTHLRRLRCAAAGAARPVSFARPALRIR